MEIKSKAIYLANNSKREQAVRLGFFAITAGFVTPENNYQKSWLRAWNNELEIIKPLTSVDLIKNPLSDNANRDDVPIKENMLEIKQFFKEIKWEIGITLMKNLYTE